MAKSIVQMENNIMGCFKKDHLKKIRPNDVDFEWELLVWQKEMTRNAYDFAESWETSECLLKHEIMPRRTLDMNSWSSSLKVCSSDHHKSIGI